MYPLCSPCRLEQRQQQRLSSLQSFNSALTLTAGKLVMFVTFMLALAAGYRVNAAMVFTAMMLFETLRVSMSILLPSGLLYVKDMLATVGRVEVSGQWGGQVVRWSGGGGWQATVSTPPWPSPP